MSTWQHDLKSCITSVTQLCDLLKLPISLFDQSKLNFPIRVPRPFINRMKAGDPNDPLLLQVIAKQDEQLIIPGFTLDPLAEHKSAIPGLLHKYPGRILVTLTGGCAINCRYCFRRHFPYNSHQALAHWPQVLDYLKHTTTVHEVILSGGDPLMIDDSKLQEIVSSLEKIDNIKTLRIHTRLPIVIPKRITDKLCDILQTTSLKTVMVLHVNHANEIDTELEKQLNKLSLATMLLNQSVLLKDINDSTDALIALSYRLWEAGVLPYYLHQLDRVSGVAHFEVEEPVGKQLIDDIRAQLPGYLVPTYVREIPNKPSKQQIY